MSPADSSSTAVSSTSPPAAGMPGSEGGRLARFASTPVSSAPSHATSPSLSLHAHGPPMPAMRGAVSPPGAGTDALSTLHCIHDLLHGILVSHVAMREEIKDVLRATNRLLVSQAAIREEIKEEIRTTNRLLGHMVAVQALTLGTVVLTAALVWRTGKS